MASIVELLKIIFSVNQADIDKFTKSLDEADKAAKKLKDTSDEAGKSGGEGFNKAAEGMNGLVKGVKTFLALSLVQEFAALAEQASKVAAAGEGVRAAFRNLGGTAEDLKKLSAAAGGTVSNIKLMELSVKSFQKGLNAVQQQKFFEYLNKQASATGASFETLGLKMLKAVEDVPKFMGEISTKTKQLGLAADGASEAYGRLEAAQANATEEFGRFINSPGYIAWLNFKASLIGGLATFLGGHDFSLEATEALKQNRDKLAKEMQAIQQTLKNNPLPEWWLKMTSGDVDEFNRLLKLKNVLDAEITLREASAKTIAEGNKEAFAASIKEQGDIAKAAIKKQNEDQLEENKKKNAKLLEEAKKFQLELDKQQREFLFGDAHKRIQEFDAEVLKRQNEADRNQFDDLFGDVTGKNSINKRFQDADAAAEESDILSALQKIPNVSDKVKKDFGEAAISVFSLVDALSSLGDENTSKGKKFFSVLQGLLGLAGTVVSIINPAAGVIKGLGIAAVGAGTAGRLLPRNQGGWIPGMGPDRDSVPTMLTPGEHVTRRRSAQMSPLLLDAINSGEINDKDFLKILNPAPIVMVNQEQVVAAINNIPQVDLYKSGAALYEVKRKANENSVSRRRRLMP